jgi:hypothetical protein
MLPFLLRSLNILSACACTSTANNWVLAFSDLNYTVFRSAVLAAGGNRWQPKGTVNNIPLLTTRYVGLIAGPRFEQGQTVGYQADHTAEDIVCCVYSICI